MRWLVLIGGAVAAVGLFLLATASGDTAIFARHYPPVSYTHLTLPTIYSV